MHGHRGTQRKVAAARGRPATLRGLPWALALAGLAVTSAWAVPPHGESALAGRQAAETRADLQRNAMRTDLRGTAVGNRGEDEPTAGGAARRMSAEERAELRELLRKEFSQNPRATRRPN